MTFSPRYTLGDTDLTDYPFAVFWGADYGAPENVAEVIDSMLVDGDVEEYVRSGNREMAFSVLIEEADLLALAEAEALLIAECRKTRNTFAIDPGDGIAVTTVFEIFRVQERFVHDDDMEWQGYRRWDLTWRALPFGRSEDETAVAALTVGAGSETTISDGTSATGWTSTGGTVTSSGGKLLVPFPAAAESVTASDVGYSQVYEVDTTLTTAAINFSTTPYMSIEFERPSTAVSATLTAAYADGVELGIVAETTIGSTTRRATLYCTDSSATVLRFVFQVTANTATSAVLVANLSLDNLKRAPRSPLASTTGRESLRSITIGGSARTEASLQVSHASAGLGDTIVYTAPQLGQGHDPSLRQFYISGGSSTTDATTISGTKITTSSSTPIVFDVPAASLPRGGYNLVARVRASTVDHTRTIDWTASTRVGSTTLGTVRSGTSPSVALTTGTYSLVTIASPTLPEVDTSESSGAVVRITLSRGTAVASEIVVDQVWLFSRGDNSALSIIHAGAGSPALGSIHNYLWLDSPTLARTEPAAWVGTADLKTDAIHAGPLADAWEVPLFPPGEMILYVATSGAADASVSARYYKRWHTHAAEAS